MQDKRKGKNISGRSRIFQQLVISFWVFFLRVSIMSSILPVNEKVQQPGRAYKKMKYVKRIEENMCEQGY